MKAVTILFVAAGFAALGQAQTWNLTADWSDSSNPNGQWSYREGVNLLPHVNSWQSSLGGFSSAQPGWAKSENGNNRLPFIYQSLGVETFANDISAGDVVMHSTDPFNGVGSGDGGVWWTAATAGLYDVSGFTWLGRDDTGRSVNWAVSVNGVTVLDSGILAFSDAFSSTNARTFSASNLLLGVGDTLRFTTLNPTGAAGDFVVFDMTVTAVPEPATLAALGLGALAMLGRRRRR